ncbi:hypothetical protein BH10PLA1_BH10PLA1_00590 [soil metagenome]
MDDTSPGDRMLDSLEAALTHGESEKSDSLVASLPAAERDGVLRHIAARALNSRQWAVAQGALQRVAEKDAASQLQHNLARNFVSLQEHRPAAYQAVVEAPCDSRFQIGNSASGLPTIFFSEQPGRATSFSINNDPLKGVGILFAKLKPDIDRGACLALCGLGDGYLLNALAQKPPKLFLTMQQAIHVIEPQPQVLMLCMMMHDYSGDSGPIKQQRFRWFVGPDWQQQAETELLGDLLTPLPCVTINQGISAAAIAAGLQVMQTKLGAADAGRKAEIEAYYLRVADNDLINRFGSFPVVPPRVLLITTRFSTVLQYSTRDAAEAFGQLGWETMTILEPSDWQRCDAVYMRKALAEFKPDFVFQIDHLRHEHGDLFPPQIPFACWIQDHLPNLCNAAAGAAVKSRDFVLSGMGSLFVQQHGYPRRQIVDLPQLSRVPMRPTEWVSDGDDIVYVSNWSKTAGQIVPELLERFSNPPALRTLIEKCCSTIVERYAAGKAVATHYDVRLILNDSEVATGVNLTLPAMKDEVVNILFDRLNNTLYRHQALQWAAETARSLGLRLALYGRGWDANPAFAAYARGPVAAGEAMELLTRQSKINLQLEPYACFSHARLLSGLFAGGFYMIRDNPFNHLTQELLNFVDRYFDAGVCSVPQARAAVKECYRRKL